MKVKKLYKPIIGALFTAIIVLGMTSCNDFDFPTDMSYSRMFRPVAISTDSVTATTAIVKWNAMAGVDHYVVEISRDSLEFGTIVNRVEVPATFNALKLTNLNGDTQHSARVMCVSGTDVADSKWINVAFKTKAEQIMLAVGAADKTSTSATVKWIAGSTVTHLTVEQVGGATSRVELTAPEMAAGVKLIESLIANTTYKVNIYNTDANLRGSVTFRTYEEVPSIGQVIYMQVGDSINLRLAEATSNAVTLVFQQGSYYQRDTPLLLKDGMSVVFYGLPGANLATISLNSITLAANHGTLRFENMNITGKFNLVDGTLATTQRDYFINQGLITNVSSLEFKNCTIHNFNRNLVRLKDAGDFKTISNLIISGCILSDQGTGGYPLIGNTIANGLIDNITISGSTFYNMSHNFIQQGLVNSTSLTISDCTFNNIVGPARYFIDCTATFGPTGAFSITNCIFGKTYDVLGKGIRSSKIPNIVNSYKTSDWVTASNPISGLTDYSGASTALFANPSTGDFTIKDSNFSGHLTAGDPRWRQ